MGQFEDYVRSFVEQSLGSIANAEATDIYVVSLFVYDEHDDPLRPTVTVGFNTETAVARQTGSAWDADEARWNYAFWLQNQLGVLCDAEEDPQGAMLRDQWIAAGGFETENETDPAFVTRQFVALLERVVLGLHEDGVIERLFGRPIPVLIHELEYYDQIAVQNMRANPACLAKPFAAWITGM